MQRNATRRCFPVKNVYNKDSGKKESSNQKDSEESKEPNTVYCPLHLNPVFYDQDLNKAKSASKQKRRAAKRFLEDADLNEEEDLPVEIYFGSSNSDAKFLSKLREREKYEEDNFTRVQLTKRERLMQKRMERGEILDTNTRIDHIRKLLESSEDEDEVKLLHPNKKRKQTKRMKRGKKGGKGKRR